MSKILLIVSSMLGLLTILTANSALAFKPENNATSLNYFEERQSQIQQALDNYDYDSWLSLMTKNGRKQKITQIVTRDNFEEFVDARSAALNGNLSKLKDFKEKYHLKLSMNKMERELNREDSNSIGKRFSRFFKWNNSISHHKINN